MLLLVPHLEAPESNNPSIYGMQTLLSFGEIHCCARDFCFATPGYQASMSGTIAARGMEKGGRRSFLKHNEFCVIYSVKQWVLRKGRGSCKSVKGGEADK